MRTARWVRAAAATVGVGVLVGWCLPMAPSSADTGGPNPNNYTLSAAANSFDVVLTDPSAPLITEYEASPYGASATLNSLGQSNSDAGAPYSPTVSGLPPLLAGLAPGQIPPLPPLPGYVAATYPGTASDSQQQGPYSIGASASQYASRGRVALGATLSGASGSTFSASAETTANADGSVTVAASTGVDLLNVGGLVDIGNFTSTARMTLSAGGKPHVTQSTSLGTVSLLGTTSGLLGSQLKLLGTGVDIPLTPTLIRGLNTLLKPAGGSLTVLPAKYMYTDGTSTVGTASPSKTIQAVDTGALQLTMTENVPTQGEVKLAVTIGRVTVSAVNTPAVALAPPPGDIDGGVSSGVDGGASDAVPEPVTDVPTPEDVVPTVPPVVSPVASPSSGNPAASPPARQVALTYATGANAEAVYLMLVLAALAALGGSALVRLLGVRAVLGTTRPAPHDRVRVRRTGADQ